MGYFKLFANCIIVSGANRSLLCDIQRGKAEFLPSQLNNILSELSKKSIIKLYENYDYDEIVVIQEYLEYLVSNEYGFFCSDVEFNCFPEMNRTFYAPYSITNCVIEINNDFELITKIIEQLEKHKCKNIHIVSFNAISIKKISVLLNLFDKSIINSIELTLKYHKSFIKEEIQKLANIHLRLNSILIYNSPLKMNIPNKNNALCKILYNNLNIKSFKFCGVVSINSFNIHQNKIFESISHNSCLNKKISIDTNGNIKNCPSMPQSFGNIKDTTLEEALNHKDFKKYWNITKDQIDVCKDCEFRYICTDCRAYIEKPEDIYSKPLKCGYNPYTNDWSEWSTNPLKQKAIEYYGMQELVKKNNEV